MDNTEFTIRICVKKPYEFTCPGLGFLVYVDGNLIEYPLLTSDAWQNLDTDWTNIIEGPTITTEGKATMKPMKFTSLKLSKFTCCHAMNKTTCVTYHSRGSCSAISYRQGKGEVFEDWRNSHHGISVFRGQANEAYNKISCKA